MCSTTHCTGWDRCRRKISRSFCSNAVRFFILGAYCGRHRPAKLRTRRKSNPRNASALQPSPWHISSVSGPANHQASLSSRPCLPCCRKSHSQQGRFAPRALPRLVATVDPSDSLSPSVRFPGVPGYAAYLAPPISRRDEEGLSSCSARPCHHAVDNHPAGVSHRISLLAMGHAAFAMSLPARPPRLKVSRPPLVRLRYRLVTRRHPYDGVVGRLQNHGFPTDPATQATGSQLLPRRDCLPQNAPAFAGRTTAALGNQSSARHRLVTDSTHVTPSNQVIELMRHLAEEHRSLLRLGLVKQ